MIELSMEYWNELAHQLLLINSLLSGFSIAIVANLLVDKSKRPIIINILKISTIAAGCFLIAVFSVVKIIMMTTNGYPLKVVENDLILPRIIGVLAFFLGIISLSVIISLAGWTKSKSTGIFTTVVGFLTLVGVMLMLF